MMARITVLSPQHNAYNEYTMSRRHTTVPPAGMGLEGIVSERLDALRLRKRF
jgi:hypothetical protein